MSDRIHLDLNGESIALDVDGNRKLLWVLRVDLAKTGTKCGCNQGICGACTVLIDNEPGRSCQIPVREINGKQILTIEGLADAGTLHPLQRAFIEKDALQCGFCTSGMILNAYGLLQKKRRPNRREIIDAMDGNLCRCGSYNRIVDAVQSAARRMK